MQGLQGKWENSKKGQRWNKMQMKRQTSNKQDADEKMRWFKQNKM